MFYLKLFTVIKKCSKATVREQYFDKMMIQWQKSLYDKNPLASDIF